VIVFFIASPLLPALRLELWGLEPAQ